MPARTRRTFLAALFVLISALPAAAAVALPPDLEAKVQKLLTDIEREPTTVETVVERSRVLWEWANVLSRTGGIYIPKNLPLVAARAPAPVPGSEVPPNFAQAVDIYARQLAHEQQDPGAFGTTHVESPGPFPVDSFQTFTVTLTIGSLGVAEGGGILVTQHMGSGTGRFQTEDPGGPGYLTVTTSRPTTRLELGRAPMFGPYGGFRGAVTFPKWIVRHAPLEKGDVVTITYGDRSAGGSGVQIGTYSNDAIPLPLFVDPGDGIDYELPAPPFAIEGGPAFGVHGFAPSIVGVGERFELSVRSEDRYYNRATGAMPAYEVTVNGERWGEIAADENAIHLLEPSFDRPGVYRFAFRSEDGTVAGVANPVWVQQDPKRRIYWGETHGHCGFAEGVGTPEGFYRYAVEDARLDFATLSEHDIWMSDAEWQILNDVSAELRVDTTLITYPGYEWTTDRARGGHHNVLFRRTGMKRVPTQEAPNLTDLYRLLEETHPAEDVLVIPHAHQAGDWRLSDLPMERLVELISGHGTFEWFGQRYLENGWRIGFVGASDDHLGHPGYSPGGQVRGSDVRTNIFQFGGLAGVYAAEKTPEAVFAAMRARSTFAVSGAQRIILDATLNGEPMGSEVAERRAAERRRVVEGRAIGTAPIQSVDLIRNGEVVARMDGFEAGSVDAGAETVRLVVSFYSDSAVFFRDNPRGHRPWNGTLTVQGAELKKATMLGTVSRLHDRAEIEDGVLAFSVATRGSARTLLLELSGVSPDARLDFALESSAEHGRAPTVVRPSARFPAASFSLAVLTDAAAVRHELEAGPYRDVVSAQRADRPREELEFHFEDLGEPDDWYYVRVIQIDGHRAWSSPWWVGGEPPL